MTRPAFVVQVRAPPAATPEPNPDPWSIAAERSSAAPASVRGDGHICGVKMLPFTPAPPPISASLSWGDLASYHRGAGGATAEARRRSASQAAAAAASAAASAGAKSAKLGRSSTSLGGASRVEEAAEEKGASGVRGVSSEGGVESIMHEISYRPALESCWTKLSAKLSEVMGEGGVSIEDNHFSLSVRFNLV